MDMPTGLAIRNIMGAIKGKLPPKDYEKLAPLLSTLIALLERAHEGERRQLRDERAAIDKEREAVTFARHSLEAEKNALGREREILEREKRVAQLWREVEEALTDAKE